MDFFRFNTLYKSYQYLSHLFLSNGRPLNQMSKAIKLNLYNKKRASYSLTGT